jgi:hypothetical protein
MNNLTPFEIAVLRAIDNSEYGQYLMNAVWTFTVADNMQPDGPTGRQLSGVISSLVQKNVVYVEGFDDDTIIGFTRKGAAAYIATVGADNTRKPIEDETGDTL